MKHSIGAVIIVLMLAVGFSIPTTSKAQGLVEYALILVLVYGNPGDSVEVAYALDHAGAVGSEQPNCSFEGTAEIDFVEVATGDSAGTASRTIILGDINSFQFDEFALPAASPGTTMAVDMRVRGRMPPNCRVVVHRSVSDTGGQTTEIAPPSTLTPGTYAVSEVVHADSSSDVTEPPLDGVLFALGGGQEVNVAIVAAPRSIAPGQADRECQFEGTLFVRRLDNGEEAIEIPFVADPVVVLADVTDAMGDPVASGDTVTFQLTFTNNRVTDTPQACDSLGWTIGVADQATGKTGPSIYSISASDPGVGILAPG